MNNISAISWRPVLVVEEAVRHGKAAIQDASDFATWADGTQGAVKYVYISKDICEGANDEIKALNVQPVKGTLKVHVVFGLGDNRIATRPASCFCPNCFGNSNFMGRCDGWEQHSLSLEQEVEMDNNVNQIAEDIPNENTDNQPGVELDDLSLYQWVAALYEGQWYIEKIQDIDRHDSDIYLTF